MGGFDQGVLNVGSGTVWVGIFISSGNLAAHIWIHKKRNLNQCHIQKRLHKIFSLIIIRIAWKPQFLFRNVSHKLSGCDICTECWSRVHTWSIYSCLVQTTGKLVCSTFVSNSHLRSVLACTACWVLLIDRKIFIKSRRRFVAFLQSCQFEQAASNIRRNGTLNILWLVIQCSDQLRMFCPKKKLWLPTMQCASSPLDKWWKNIKQFRAASHNNYLFQD